MNGHTPGPWRVEGAYVVGDDGVIARQAAPYSAAPDDLRLIAAAPELLEALRWYVQNDETNDGQEGNEFWLEGRDLAIAAIAAAIGEKA